MLFEIALVMVAGFFLYGIHGALLDLRYRLPPGPLPLPFAGTVYLHLGTSEKPWQILARCAKKYGPVVTTYFGQIRFILLNRVDIIRRVLVGNSKVFSDRPDSFMPGFSGYTFGPVSSSGDMWSRQRRFVVRALRDFGMGKKAMEAKIQNEIDFFRIELDCLADSSTPIVRNVNKLMSNAVSNIISTLVFGKRFAYDDETFVRLFQMMYKTFSTPFYMNALYFAMPILGKFNHAPMVRDSLKIRIALREYLDKIIHDHQLDFDSDNIRDLPDLFLLSKSDPENEISYETFVAISRDLFLAGTETTATSLTWTVLYLCKWPDYQTKCQEAIDKVIRTDRLPTLEDRPHLIYLDAVMCEILRHVTIAPMGLLHANIDNPATIEGFEIPANSIICYNIWSVHNNGDYWEDPSVFRPERWIDENGKLLTHSNHFMPFGIGPRMCLGENLARVEYFLFVTALLHRYNFSFQPGYDVDLESGSHNFTNVPPKFEFVISKRVT